MDDDECGEDFDNDKYDDAKTHWDKVFKALEPRDDSDEEREAFWNALEDRMMN